MDETTHRAIWPVTTAAMGALIASVVWFMLIPVASGACGSPFLHATGPLGLLVAGIAVGVVLGAITASRPWFRGATPIAVCFVLTSLVLYLGHSRASTVLATCNGPFPGITLLSREVIQNALHEQDEIGNKGGSFKTKIASIGGRPGVGGGPPKREAGTTDVNDGASSHGDSPDSGGAHPDASTPPKGSPFDAGNIGGPPDNTPPVFHPSDYKSPPNKNPLDKVAAVAVAAACLAATENPLLCAAIGQAFGFAFGDGHDGQSLQEILNSPQFVDLMNKSTDELTELVRKQGYAECKNLQNADDATRKECEQLANDLAGMVQNGRLYGDEFENGRRVLEQHIKKQLDKLCPGTSEQDPLCCLRLRFGKGTSQLKSFCQKNGNDAMQEAGSCLLRLKGDQQVLLKTYQHVLCEAAR